MTVNDSNQDNSDLAASLLTQEESNMNGATPRNRFVSKHRQELDRIVSDSSRTVRHHVPEAAESQDESSLGDTSFATRRRTITQWSLAKAAAFFPSNRNEWLEATFPSWRWMRQYAFKSTFPKDLVAGLTVGVMVVPQGMSYAKLAGLPVQYGLYSAFLPVYAYAFFGSSRQLAVGPVALVSLLLNTGLTDVMKKLGVSPDDDSYDTRYATLAIQASFLVGIAYIIMGILRLGFITNFMSHAVVSGFTSGAAVIIGVSQLKYILGYKITQSDRLVEVLSSLIDGIKGFSWKTFLLGTFSIGILLTMKNVGKHVPRLKFMRALGPLTVTVLTIVLVVTCSLDEKGIPVVGAIPSGLPNFTGSLWFPVEGLDNLVVLVTSLVIVGFMESIAIAKKLAAKHKYEIDSSQELIGLGMANFCGAMFQAYPVTGSFSRSAVNNDSGAVSGVSGLVTATLVGFVLLVLTPVFEHIPQAVLGAIVISGVLGLLDFGEAMYLYRVHRFDCGVWVVAFLGTMFLGVEIGLGIAVGVSLLIVIWESAYPHTKILGRLPGTTVYRPLKQYPEAERYDGVLMVRIDAPLYFANAQNVRDKIRKYRLIAEEEQAERNVAVRFFILEMSPVSHIDTSALHILDDMYDNYQSRSQQLCFVNPSMLVMERFVQSGLADKIGREHFFICMHDAVSWCLHELDCKAVSEHEVSNGDIEEVEKGEQDALTSSTTA